MHTRAALVLRLFGKRLKKIQRRYVMQVRLNTKHCQPLACNKKKKNLQLQRQNLIETSSELWAGFFKILM